jgi:hypothetical protein
MALEITGKLIKKLPLQSGTSERGTWSRQEIIIEIPGQYPTNACISLWGDRVADANLYNEGDQLKISINIQSREYNGRWYTDLRAWRIERDPDTLPAVNAPVPSAPEVPSAPNSVDDTFSTSPEKEVDDLPF